MPSLRAKRSNPAEKGISMFFLNADDTD